MQSITKNNEIELKGFNQVLLHSLYIITVSERNIGKHLCRTDLKECWKSFLISIMAI